MSKYNNKIVLILPLCYFIAVSGLLIWHGTWFSPDQFFIAAIFIVLFLGRTKQFIKDWSVPVILLLSYDYLRGLVPKLTQTVHIYPMINFDKLIFGELPTNSLQYVLFSSQKVAWYDYLSTFLYMSHFITPLIIGFVFWIKDRKNFSQFFLALLLLSYAAFFTYIVFPAMPPWMAAKQGIIPVVNKVMDQVFITLPTPIHLPTVYKIVGTNLVAAVPSLHAAYPFLVLLFLIKKYKAKGLLILPYVLGVWFAIVYMGEHYVFDVFIGALYALIIFLLVLKLDQIFQKKEVRI